MTGYLNIFEDGNKKMPFFTDNNEFLERYTKIWEKISDLIDKKFDSDPVYNNKYINTKIRSYNNDIITNFHDIDNKKNKLPEKNKAYKCMFQASSRGNLHFLLFLADSNVLIISFFL